MDVSSSSVAANIVGLVQGLTKSLCVDMAICLEGHSPEELPESLLGTVRCSHLDLNSAKLLDTATGVCTPPPSLPPCSTFQLGHSSFFPGSPAPPSCQTRSKGAWQSYSGGQRFTGEDSDQWAMQLGRRLIIWHSPPPDWGERGGYGCQSVTGTFWQGCR